MVNSHIENNQSLTAHGKLIFKPYEPQDYNKLLEFCEKCKDLDFHNNVDLKAIKFDRMVMPYGMFFVGIDTEKDIIFTLAGVHRLPEINDRAWRCLFRGAQLPGYNVKFSKNMFDIAWHFSHLLYLQLTYIMRLENQSEFYITTNIEDNNNGLSSKINKIMMPHVEKTGIWKLYLSDELIYNTRQNVWKIDIDEYFKQRLHWQSCPK